MLETQIKERRYQVRARKQNLTIHEVRLFTDIHLDVYQERLNRGSLLNQRSGHELDQQRLSSIVSNDRASGILVLSSLLLDHLYYRMSASSPGLFSDDRGTFPSCVPIRCYSQEFYVASDF